MPLFEQMDGCINFSIEMEHPWIKEKSWIFGPTSAEIEFQNFQQQHKGEFLEMVREIKESVIPKMDAMISAVSECLSGNYTEGKR